MAVVHIYQLCLMIVCPSGWYTSTLWLLVIVLVKLMNIKASASLVHIHTCVDCALNLDCLGSVTLLCVQLTSVSAVYWLYLH